MRKGREGSESRAWHPRAPHAATHHLNPLPYPHRRLHAALEPILFPKLRIYFADFPYLRYSIGQRLFTLETCCGYGYEFARNLHTSLPILSRANASASDGTRPVPLLVVAHPISGQTDSRVLTLRFEPLNKKRQLSPKLALT